MTETLYPPNDVVMLVPVLDLISALDRSVDFMCYCDAVDSEGNEIECSGWRCLFDNKIDDCGEAFIESVLTDGVQAPIVVEIRGKEWIQGNGNHRLAVMFRYDPFGEVPVLFSRNGYMRTEISEADDEGYVDSWS